MLVVFVDVKFVKYGRKKIRNSVRMLTFTLGAFTRILYFMTQLCFAIEVIGLLLRQSIFSFQLSRYLMGIGFPLSVSANDGKR
jgi:hypothetical protein